MAFDSKKPFGYVRGLPGVKYEQDGSLYSPQGDVVDLEGNPLTKAAPKTKAKAKAEAGKPDGVRPMSEQAEDNA